MAGADLVPEHDCISPARADKELVLGNVNAALQRQLQPDVIGSKVLGTFPSVLRSVRITVNMPW